MKSEFRPFSVLAAVLCLATGSAVAQVERVWLTSRSENAGSVVVNWETVRAGESVVEFGAVGGERSVLKVAGERRRHQVEIPLDASIETYHYRVKTGDQQSGEFSFTPFPEDELRVAVVANWHQKPKLDALLKDDVHLLLTAGDIVLDLNDGGGDSVEPYRKLIDAYPELFRSTIFLPVLGNHDRQIRPRGSAPPAEPVYDVEATAFRRFFPLPDEGWKWSYSIQGFDVEFFGLDLSHISDQGTTWQSCHPFDQGSEQFKWYRERVGATERKFVVTLYNEKNGSVRQQADGEWHRLLSRGTAVISGYGYFGERAEKDGVPYLNTSLNGTGDKYPDSNSKFFRSVDNYVLLRFRREADVMKVEMKNLRGEVLDASKWSARR